MRARVITVKRARRHRRSYNHTYDHNDPATPYEKNVLAQYLVCWMVVILFLWAVLRHHH